MITIQEIREAMLIGQENVHQSKRHEAKKWIEEEITSVFLGIALRSGARNHIVCIPHNIDCSAAIEIFKELGYEVSYLDYDDFGYDKAKSDYEQLNVRWA